MKERRRKGLQRRPANRRDEDLPGVERQSPSAQAASTIGNHAFTRLLAGGGHERSGGQRQPSVPAVAIARELSDKQRRRIEKRTGPLVRPLYGAPRGAVPARTRERLRTQCLVNLEAWKSACQTAVGDFVRDHDHATAYGPLALAIVAAPLGVIGVGLTGTAAVTVAVASASISVVGAVPALDDPIAGFRDRMRDSYNRVYENRVNSVDNIVWNYLLSVPPSLAADPEQLTVDFSAHTFSHTTGAAVNGTEVAADVRRRLEAKWERARKAALHEALFDPRRNPNIVLGM